MSDDTQQPIDPQQPPVVQDIPAPAEQVTDQVAEPVAEAAPEQVAAPPAPVPPAPEAPAPETQAPAQWPAAGYAAPAAASYPPAAYPAYPAAAAPVATQTSSNAVVALILAVASWAVCPLVAAIVALVFASMASKEIAASGGRIQGEGLVTASKIVAWINIGLMAAAVIIGAFVLVLVAVAGGFNSTSG